MNYLGKIAVGILFMGATWLAQGAVPTERLSLPGYVPAVTTQLTSLGDLPATNQLALAIGLPLHNEVALDALIAQLSDPGSPNFHKFLTPSEFTARFGPTEAEYQQVIQFAETNGLTVAGTYSNRMVLDVTGRADNIGRAFGVHFRTYQHPTEGRHFFATDTDPSIPTNLPVADMWGLSDYRRPHPQVLPANVARPTPLNYNGSGTYGAYMGMDFRHAYAPGTPLSGAGQSVAVVEFDGYYANDITNYEYQAGYTNVPLQNILVDGVSGTPGYSGVSNADIEVSLDIELAIAIAPGLAKVNVYEGDDFYDVFSQIATDDSARQISCSWSYSSGPTTTFTGHRGSTLDSLLKQMVTQGQAFFQASGDSDAYTGSQAFSRSSGPIPVDSIYVTSVGGTSLTMSGTGVAWSSETTWNYGNNEGSGGGISGNYSIPSWQAGINMATNSGSTVYRNVPDVALTADAVYCIYGNGSTGPFAGTSCAAPLWAGFAALVNQQTAAHNSTNAIGFFNPPLYAIATNSNYSTCFHDITTGNNIGTNTAGLFYATNGYDLATGLGTPNGTNLINALAPRPGILTQPVSQIVSNGLNATFTVTPLGAPTLYFQWLLNGTNLSGANASTLTLTSPTPANAGNYALVITNAYGAITSSVATLTVIMPPVIANQPINLTVVSGGTAVFSATVNGSLPLTYQWLKNGTNLVNGTGINGATTNTLTLTSVTTNRSGNYALWVTNLYGSATSSVALLNVVVAPNFSAPALTNQTLQCDSNWVSYTLNASGTTPLFYQWSLDGTPVPGATNITFSLTNLLSPSHTVSVTVTNLYGSATSDAVLTVQDTLAPVMTLNGSNPFYVEYGQGFVDPGATAYDLCVGAVGVSITGSVNTNAVSTNTLFYMAGDGNGNTNTITRTVIVRDTTPPTIVWSFTNLVLAATTNCSASMPDVTGTNDIIATDLSGVAAITETPTTNSLLAIGTNTVILTVTDPYGNAAYSTNTIVVLESPPVIITQPQGQTNTIGSTANFSVIATACSSLTYNWFFNTNALAAATNSLLTLTHLKVSQAGNYFVVVTSAGGVVTSSIAMLSLNVTTTPDIVSNPDGSLTLQFTGTSGYTYVLESSANLIPVNWQPIATNTMDATGTWTFNFTPTTNSPQNFYRFRLVQ